MITSNHRLLRGLGLVLTLSLCAPWAAQSAVPKHPHAKPAKSTKPARKKVATPVPVLPMPVKNVPDKDVPVDPDGAVPGEILLFNGETFKDSGLTATSWGGGKVEDSKEVAFASAHSIKITTFDFYQGARISFDKPVSLNVAGDPKSTFFQLVFRFVHSDSDASAGPLDPIPGLELGTPVRTAGLDGAVVSGQGAGFGSGVYHGGAHVSLAQFRGGGPPPGFGGGGPPPGFGGGGPPAKRPSGGPPPGFGGGGPPPGFGGGGPPTGRIPGAGAQRAVPTDTFAGPPFSTFRFLFTLANGTQADILRDVPESDGDHWIYVGIPLSAIKFPAGSSAASLQSVTISGDQYGAIYVGQIKLVPDTTPITCFAGAGQDVSKGDNVTFHAEAAGGASTLKYSWDFDAADGITEQAHGQTVTTQYFKGDKDYKVTLTVSDVDNIKKSATSTTIVHVEE